MINNTIPGEFSPTKSPYGSNESWNQTGTVFVVLPAYNEETGLSRLLDKISHTFSRMNTPYEVIVVNDASTDATAHVASKAALKMPVQLVNHDVNRGLSGAIKSGIERAMEEAVDGDIILSMDADDTHSPSNIPSMLKMIDDGYDVVISSRYRKGSKTIGVPAVRLMMTFFARWLFKLIIPINGVRDYTCGYRAYRFEAMEKAMNHHRERFFTEEGFSCMVDIILKMRGFGFKFGEVPMVLRYDQKEGASKMRVLSTAHTTIALLIRRRLGW